jgi:hypothetical protein
VALTGMGEHSLNVPFVNEVVYILSFKTPVLAKYSGPAQIAANNFSL